MRGDIAEGDVPPRWELFILGDDEKKVTWELDTRTYNPPAAHRTMTFANPLAGVPHTATFTFNKEDHTLGNLLASRLHKYEFVKFSAYKIPHPLFAKFELRVTTDGSVSPKEAIVQCCRDLVGDLDMLSREFTKEWELKKIAGQGEK